MTTATDQQGEFINAAALAVKLNVSLKTIRTWDARRQIPGRVQFSRRCVRFRLNDVEKRLASGQFLTPARVIG